MVKSQSYPTGVIMANYKPDGAVRTANSPTIHLQLRAARGPVQRMERVDRAPADEGHFSARCLGDLAIISSACTLELYAEPMLRIFAHGSRHADASWPRKPAWPHSCIAEDVATVGHDIAHIDADTELNPPFLWYVGMRSLMPRCISTA